MKTILFVDDDSSALSIYREIAEAEGYGYRGCTTVDKAMKSLAAEGIPDLIFVDYQMEPENGAEFVARAKAEFPAIAKTRIVGLTGFHPGAPEVKEFLGLVSELAPKPHDLDEFVTLIKRHLPACI